MGMGFVVAPRVEKQKRAASKKGAEMMGDQLIAASFWILNRHSDNQQTKFDLKLSSIASYQM